ncbi:hypothetical protein ALC62_04081 [Cyphomyrmex costatus]|uniref:Uncharacterized protein n=1 Tax=Cyphomyrmex costatus TaxID=456900 RepID=A0A151IKP2_9HYME|nr:hypothetical protein ALC62_04081 [Cyphomyrmex costatus]
MHWLTRLSSEALNIFRQSTRGHEIIDMPLYREFCDDVVAQLEKPSLESSTAMRADRKQPDERERTATSRRNSKYSSRGWYLFKDGITVSPARMTPYSGAAGLRDAFFTLTDTLGYLPAG